MTVDQVRTLSLADIKAMIEKEMPGVFDAKPTAAKTRSSAAKAKPATTKAKATSSKTAAKPAAAKR